MPNKPYVIKNNIDTIIDTRPVTIMLCDKALLKALTINDKLYSFKAAVKTSTMIKLIPIVNSPAINGGIPPYNSHLLFLRLSAISNNRQTTLIIINAVFTFALNRNWI